MTIFNRTLLFVSCCLLTACASTNSEPKVYNQSNAVDKETAKEIDLEIQNGLTTMIEEDPELQALPGEPTFEELEEEFAAVNKDQIKVDIMKLGEQIGQTEQELNQAQSLLAKMISENKPAGEISAQKSRVVVLEDQLFDLNDEKSLKEIEASIE